MLCAISFLWNVTASKRAGVFISNVFCSYFGKITCSTICFFNIDFIILPVFSDYDSIIMIFSIIPETIINETFWRIPNCLCPVMMCFFENRKRILDCISITENNKMIMWIFVYLMLSCPYVFNIYKVSRYIFCSYFAEFIAKSVNIPV